MADEIAEIRRRVDIVELIGQSVALKQKGRSWEGLCPFHNDRNPSFRVSPDIGYYRCWSCGAKGDAFTWVMETQRVDFAEALRQLAKLTGVELTKHRPQDASVSKAREDAMAEALIYFRQNLKSHEAARDFLKDRGLNEDAVLIWEIGFAPDLDYGLATHLKKKGISLAEAKSLYLVDSDAGGGYYDRFKGRIMFPIRDERGILVAFGGRIIGSGQPKYINSSDTPLFSKSRVLYGMNKAKEAMARSKTAVLVEGYIDVIACHRAGVQSAVASLGTSLAEEQVKLLKRWCESIVILYDADSAGQKAAERASEMLTAAGLRVKVALMPQGEDPDSLLRLQGPAAVLQVVEGAALGPVEYRLWQLRKRLTPDQEEYWTEIVPILAASPTELELERHLHAASAEYPGTPDRVAAKQALKQMVLRQRRSQKPVAEEGTEAKPTQKSVRFPGAEKAILRGLLNPLTRVEALRLLGVPGLFASKVGSKLARILAESVKPSDLAAEGMTWITDLEDETARDLMIDLAWQDEAPVTAEILAEAAARLRTAFESREAQAMKENPDDLAAWMEKQRSIRGDRRPKLED